MLIGNTIDQIVEQHPADVIGSFMKTILPEKNRDKNKTDPTGSRVTKVFNPLFYRGYRLYQFLTDYKNHLAMMEMMPNLIEEIFNQITECLKTEYPKLFYKDFIGLLNFYLKHEQDRAINCIIEHNVAFILLLHLEFAQTIPFLEKLLNPHFNEMKITLSNYEKLWTYLRCTNFFVDLAKLMIKPSNQFEIMKCDVGYKPLEWTVQYGENQKKMRKFIEAIVAQQKKRKYNATQINFEKIGEQAAKALANEETPQTREPLGTAEDYHKLKVDIDRVHPFFEKAKVLEEKKKRLGSSRRSARGREQDEDEHEDKKEFSLTDRGRFTARERFEHSEDHFLPKIYGTSTFKLKKKAYYPSMVEALNVTQITAQAQAQARKKRDSKKGSNTSHLSSQRRPSGLGGALNVSVSSREGGGSRGGSRNTLDNTTKSGNELGKKPNPNFSFSNMSRRPSVEEKILDESSDNSQITSSKKTYSKIVVKILNETSIISAKNFPSRTLIKNAKPTPLYPTPLRPIKKSELEDILNSEDMRADRVKAHEILATPVSEFLNNLLSDHLLYYDASKIATMCGFESTKHYGILLAMLAPQGTEFFKAVLEVCEYFPVRKG